MVLDSHDPPCDDWIMTRTDALDDLADAIMDEDVNLVRKVHMALSHLLPQSDMEHLTFRLPMLRP